VTLAPGLHRLSADEYHADPAPRPSLSSTLARKLLDQSPLHAWTASPRLNPDWQPTDRKTFDVGRAAHREVLGAGADYAVIPDDILAVNGAASTKAAKDFIAAAREAGRTPISAETAELVETMAAKLRPRLREAGITLDPDRSELAALAEIDGVCVRALIDNAPERSPYLIDFKTTMDASPAACIRSVTGYSYDVQAAHYLDAWEAATGERRRMLFIFQEKEPPFEVGFVELHDAADDEADWLLDARHKCAEARLIWGECLASGVWPGYPARIAVVGAPSWHRAKWADRSVKAPVPKSAIARSTAWQSPEGMR
jgi:hypothetical protein